MLAIRTAAPTCTLCPWLISLGLLGIILALSIFGSGVVVGQWLARDGATVCPARAWP